MWLLRMKVDLTYEVHGRLLIPILLRLVLHPAEELSIVPMNGDTLLYYSNN